MKKFNSFILVLILGIASVGFTSCEKDEHPEEEAKGNTITDVAVSNPNFSILVQALTKAGLADDLASMTGDFTVFAPTNAAFTALLTELKVASLNDIPTDVLTKVLLYHVKSGEAKASQITTGYYSTIAAGPATGSFLSFYVDMATTTINGRSKITQTDIMADNGVIHVIDKVMLPMSITDHAVANPVFSSLVAAVTKANLAAALDDEAKTYTVFAPTNAAFTALLTSLGVTLNALSAETLSPILLYHVVNAYVPSSAVASGYVPTLSSAFGKSVSLQISVGTGVKLNNSANVVATDVVATNGIIHVIDQVVLPPTVVEIAQQNSSFSTLVQAVVKAELATTLSRAGPFTVFAPTNEAFAALFTSLGVTGIPALTKEQLTPILLAHVVSGNVQSGSLTSGSVPTLNSSKPLNVVISGSGVTINGSVGVVKADVQGKNGVVHVINKVIVP
jgi:transforming growth factor-beta-induced protein